jgi:hypothetical protein
VQKLIEDQGAEHIFVNDDLFREAKLLPAWATRRSINKQAMIAFFTSQGYDILDWVPGKPAGVPDSTQPVHLDMHLAPMPPALLLSAESTDHCNVFRAANSRPATEFRAANSRPATE